MEDVFILCHWQDAHAMADAFSTQFQDSSSKASVLAHGSTNKPTIQGIGFIVIEWEGNAPTEFLHQLDINHDIIDYAVYEVPSYYETSA